MPDKDAKLTEEEKKDAIDWIEHRAPNLTCTVCGQKHFTIGEHAVSTLIHGGKGFILGGSAYPQIMVICTNCGHTIHFNAVLMGIFKREETKGEEPPASSDDREKADG